MRPANVVFYLIAQFNVYFVPNEWRFCVSSLLTEIPKIAFALLFSCVEGPMIEVSIIGPGHAKTCLMSYANNKGADMYTCYIQKFKILASFCSWAGTWSKIPEDTFSHDVAQLSCSMTKPTKWPVRRPAKSQIKLCMTKPIKWSVRPAKTQISLGIHPVWSESSLSVWRNIGSLATHRAHS